MLLFTDFFFNNMGGSNTKRVVLLGKPGAGKSSLANTIFGKDVFMIYHTFNYGTTACRAETRSVNGRNINLIITPGFFNTHRPEDKLRPKIVRCLTECAPGPHAFLIVLKVERFTEQEQDAINKIQQFFSEEALKYATVVFTHGDQLPDGETIENYVQDYKSVSDLVNKCGGRCHVIDNKYWNRNTEDENRSNQFQVEKLLNTIEKMVMKNNGRCFTNEMLQAVEEEIQQEEEQIRQTSGNMSEEEIREEAKYRVYVNHCVRSAGTNTKRIVLLGKTGAGKSSLANTIFGKEFKINNTLNSGTRRCRAETRSVNGRNITLIDTPGLFDTDRSEGELKSEIVRCITECAPGPHAFLIVLKVEKFTEHEQAVINKIQEYFSEEAFKYATVVFTHGDQLCDRQIIENFVLQNKFLSDLVKKCGDRCHVIDNKYWNKITEDKYRSNWFQVEKLLKSIDTMMMENNGNCYTNEMLQAVEKEIQQGEEQIRQTSGNMSEEEIREEAQDSILTNLSARLAGIETCAVIGAFCGVAVLTAILDHKTLEEEKIKAAAAAGGTRAGGAAVAEGRGAALGGTFAAGGSLVGDGGAGVEETTAGAGAQAKGGSAGSGARAAAGVGTSILGALAAGVTKALGAAAGVGTALFGAAAGVGTALFGAAAGVGTALFRAAAGVGTAALGALAEVGTAAVGTVAGVGTAAVGAGVGIAAAVGGAAGGAAAVGLAVAGGVLASKAAVKRAVAAARELVEAARRAVAPIIPELVFGVFVIVIMIMITIFLS